MLIMVDHYNLNRFRKLELGTFLLVGTYRFGDDVGGELNEIGVIKTNEFGANIYTVYSRGTDGLYSQVCNPSYMLYDAYKSIDYLFGHWKTFNCEEL